MTTIHCIKKKCLNNSNGMCTAISIEYDRFCQTYITANSSSRFSVGRCHRDKGSLKYNQATIVR